MIHTLHQIVWGPWLLAAFLAAGAGLSVRFRLFQILHLKGWLSRTAGSLFSGAGGGGHISQFATVCTALAATVGTGNIVGVATAITAGGPGALFWMWVSAFLGMMTAYAEVWLGIRYRFRRGDGRQVNGPMAYMERGAGSRGMAGCYALFCLLSSLGMGSMVQANSISDAFHNAFGLPKLAVGLVTAAVAAFIFLGGVKRIAAVTEKLVPIMALFYIIGCVIILVMNASAIPNAFVQIFTLAFQPQAIAGGVAGVTVQQAMRYGVARGLFSNEAGLGSTPHAHALAKVKQPQDQGALAIIGVFVDTFVILTLTALVLITSGLIPEGMTGTALTQAAFNLTFGSFGKVFIAICMLFFAFSTILGWYFFGQVNFNALFGSKYTKVYSLIVVLFILIGSSLKVDLVWALADFFNGLMAVPNLLALLALSGVVAGIARNKKD